MPLKQSDIEELKEIHREEHDGEELDDQEAWEIGNNLMQLGKALLHAQTQKVEKSPPNILKGCVFYEKVYNK